MQIDESTPSLTAPGLRLDPLRESDAEEMHAVLSSPTLYEFTGGEPPTPEGLHARYAAQVAGSGQADEVWHNWIVRRADDSVAVGFVQATVEPDAVDMAWTIGVPWQGQGYASAAAGAMASWLAKDNEVLTAFIHPEHEASGRVAAKIGLQATGTFDEDGEQRWEFAPPTS